MYRKQLRDRPTGWVVRQYMSASRQFEIRLQPRLVLEPWAWATRFRKNSWAGKSRALSEELGERYRGVLYECWSASGVSDNDLAPMVGSFWSDFHATIYELASPEEFSTRMWKKVNQLAAGEVKGAFKRKFMLRQFIEDLPAGWPRDTLRELGFERTRTTPRSTVASLGVLVEAYKQLHEVLLTSGLSVAKRTDNVFEKSVLSKMAPPYAEYEAWIFPSE